MNKEIILIDIDDVVWSLLSEWVSCLNKRFNRTVKISDIKSWSVGLFFKGIPVEDVYAPLYEESLWKNLKLCPNAKKIIKKLIDEGSDIYFVTASSYLNVKYKVERFKELLPFIAPERIIITLNKQLIKGHILIDDGIHNLEGGDYKKILFTRPHNEGYNAEENGMLRVKNWNEVYEAIIKLRKEGI